MFPKVYFQRGKRGALLEKFRAPSGVQKKIIPTRKLNGVDLLRLQDIQKRIYEARLCLGLNPQKIEMSMVQKYPSTHHHVHISGPIQPGVDYPHLGRG